MIRILEVAMKKWAQRRVERETPSTHRGFFGILDEIRAICREVARELGPFSRAAAEESPRQIIASIYFLRIIDTVDAIRDLVVKGSVSQGEILGRSIVDLMFRFAYLAKSEDAARELVDDYLFTRRQSAKYLGKVKDPLLQKIAAKVPLAEVQAAIQKDIDEFEVRERRVFAWAEKAGLEDVYWMTFHQLSGATHSTMMHLQLEHLVVDGDEVRLRRAPSQQGLEGLLVTAAESAFAALGNLYAVIGREPSEEAKALRERFDRLAREGAQRAVDSLEDLR